MFRHRDNDQLLVISNKKHRIVAKSRKNSGCVFRVFFDLMESIVVIGKVYRNMRNRSMER